MTDYARQLDAALTELGKRMKGHDMRGVSAYHSLCTGLLEVARVHRDPDIAKAFTGDVNVLTRAVGMKVGSVGRLYDIVKNRLLQLNAVIEPSWKTAFDSIIEMIRGNMDNDFGEEDAVINRRIIVSVGIMKRLVDQEGLTDEQVARVLQIAHGAAVEQEVAAIAFADDGRHATLGPKSFVVLFNMEPGCAGHRISSMQKIATPEVVEQAAKGDYLYSLLTEEAVNCPCRWCDNGRSVIRLRYTRRALCHRLTTISTALAELDLPVLLMLKIFDLTGRPKHVVMADEWSVARQVKRAALEADTSEEEQ